MASRCVATQARCVPASAEVRERKLAPMVSPAFAAIGCNNGVFGDPAYGLSKTCEYQSTSGTTVTAPEPVPAPTVWTWCAGEGGTCGFSGTHQVRYGANGSYAYKSATGAISCGNGAFGDPAYGMAKWCEYAN